MRSLGIDVGGVRKNLDVVLIDERRVPHPVRSGVRPEDVGRLIEELGPDIVAIDSPPAWAKAGNRSRATERQLAALHIQSFNTPAREHGEGKAFFEWMRVGFRVFDAAARRGYPRYRGGEPKGTAIEVFPHASEAVLANCLRPDSITKKAWRLRILRTEGVRVADLRTIDQVDAAVAALTGLIALDGRHFAPGDPAEGVIVLPTWSVSGPFLLCADPGDRDDGTLFRYCACGCGTQVKPPREFAKGHDGRHKSMLWDRVREGRRAEKELERRTWKKPVELT